MKKSLKFIVALILMFSVSLIMFQLTSNASYSDTMGTLINQEYSDSTGTTSNVTNITATVITSIRVVGICVAIVMLLSVAMKYMVAAPSEKADIKKSSIQYVVGAIVLFGVVGILTIISNFATAVQ